MYNVHLQGIVFKAFLQDWRFMELLNYKTFKYKFSCGHISSTPTEEHSVIPFDILPNVMFLISENVFHIN